MTPELAAKHTLLLAGIGWGSLPDLLVEDDLAAGRFVRLRVRDWIGKEALRRLPLVAAYRRDCPLGSAGRWLLDRLGPSDAVSIPIPVVHGRPPIERHSGVRQLHRMIQSSRSRLS